MDVLGIDGYKVVKNFISQEQCEFFQHYCKISHQLNFDKFDPTTDFDTGIYGSKAMESLMLSKQKDVEKLTGLKLFPTYSFWRMYTNQSVLKLHTDRPSCEYSVTLMLGSDGTPWEFVAKDKSYVQQPGDAIIYKGCDVPHGRPKPYEGDWHAQVFIHYVNADGPNKDYKFDKRQVVGQTKNNANK